MAEMRGFYWEAGCVPLGFHLHHCVESRAPITPLSTTKGWLRELTAVPNEAWKHYPQSAYRVPVHTPFNRSVYAPAEANAEPLQSPHGVINK